MEFIVNILRIVQLLWILLITALIGNVIASNVDAASSAEAAINFTMFVTVLAWIAALYGLAASFVSALAMPIVVLALDGVTTLFTFISAVVLAAKLTAVNCADLVRSPYFLLGIWSPIHNHLLTRASLTEQQAQRLHRIRLER